MKISNAIKKVERRTGNKMYRKGNFYRANYNGSYIEFSRNGNTDSITCICTAKIGEESCSMTDYFPQVFHDNITQALNFIGA